MSNLIKIRPVGGELFHADGRMDRQTRCNNAKVPKSGILTDTSDMNIALSTPEHCTLHYYRSPTSP